MPTVRLRVDVHEVCEVAVLLLVIQRQHPVAMRAGLGQISPPKVGRACRPVCHEQQIRIATGFRSRQHFIDPVEGFSDTALDQHAVPQSVVDRQLTPRGGRGTWPTPAPGGGWSTPQALPSL